MFTRGCILMLSSHHVTVTHHPPLEAPPPSAYMNSTTFDLFEAAKAGTKDDAALAIAFGADINAQNHIGFTPLMYAAWRGNAPVVDLLLRMPQVNVNLRCPEGLTAAHFAGSECPSKLEASAVEVFRLLARHGADLNARTSTGGDTPIMRAAASKLPAVVACLAGMPECDLTATDVEGRSVLTWCAEHGTAEIVEMVRAAMLSREGKPAPPPPEAGAPAVRTPAIPVAMAPPAKPSSPPIYVPTSQ